MPFSLLCFFFFFVYLHWSLTQTKIIKLFDWLDVVIIFPAYGHWLQETLVRSSNTLAVKALKAGKKHINFVKSCLAFSEVTIPSISTPTKHLNLYLETAEVMFCLFQSLHSNFKVIQVLKFVLQVALLGGLISHSDGLVMSAVEYLEYVAVTDGEFICIEMFTLTTEY